MLLRALAGWTVLASLFPEAILARPQISLDGVWAFRFSEDDRGETEQWSRPGVAYPNAVRVPGSWDVQGIGESTKKVRHNAVGVGWHRRSFKIRPDWEDRRVWLRVGGAH